MLYRSFRARWFQLSVRTASGSDRVWVRSRPDCSCARRAEAKQSGRLRTQTGSGTFPFTTEQKCLESRTARIIFDVWRKPIMRRSICLLTLLLIILQTGALAQVKSVVQYIDDVKAITNRADLKAADDYIDRNHESILHEWISITEINATSGQEQQRAKYIESLLRKYHLDDVHYDSAGNLIAVRRGAGGGPLIVFDAH